MIHNKLMNMCPLCKNRNTVFIYGFDDSPTMQHKFYSDYKKAIQQKPVSINLYGCSKCGLVFNYPYDIEKVKFSGEYDNRAGSSKFFSAHLVSIARRLMKKYRLKNKRVVDVGCGKGELLEIFQKLGVKKLKGFDKTYVPNNSKLDKLITPSYMDDSNSGIYDLIISCQVLQYIQNPVEFVRFLTAHLTHHGTMYFEMLNLDWIFKNRSIFDFYYEFPTYLSKSSLSYIFSGFDLKFGSVLGGQFLWLEANKKYKRTEKTKQKSYPIPDFNYMREFITKELDRYTNIIGKIPKPFAVWGAGARGPSFLSRLKVNTSECPYIIDINPNKQGKFLPITGQKIVSPEILKEGIKTVIIANPIYEKEIRALSKKLGYKGNFIKL